jgi:IclR family transcriptional regulator, pca regulon regulatory protein
LSEPDRRYFVGAIERAIRVLEALAGERRGLSMSDVATLTHMDGTTALRVVYTLEHLGYLERDPETKRYLLGGKVLSHGFAAMRSSGVIEKARPFVADLCERSGTTTDLAIREGVVALIVALYKKRPMSNVLYELGAHTALHCSALGKALLMDFSREQLGELLGEGPFMRFGPRSIRDLESLSADLDASRSRKYATSDGEVEEDLVSVAAPIRDENNAIVASLSANVSRSDGPTEAFFERVAPMVVATAWRISQLLGAPTWPNPRGAAH